MGKGMMFMTRHEQMVLMPDVDMLIVEEFDQTLVDYPYAFLPNGDSKFNGIWNWSKYQVVGLSATAQGEVQEIFEDVIAKPDPVLMLTFQSELEVVTEQSTMNGDVVALPEGANILAKIIDKLDDTYKKMPSICFLDECDQKKLVTHAKSKAWNTYNKKQLASLVNLKSGILILGPQDYRGLNTKFAITARVEVGCKVTSEAQRQQMMGRSNRARGVCEGTVYINTGEDEASFNRRISVTDYNKLTDHIELLIHLADVQKNPTAPEMTRNGRAKSNKMLLRPDVEVAQDEWNEERYLTSLKQLNSLIEQKEGMND